MLWAVDLTLSYSNSLAMFQLMQFTTGGTLDPKTHFFDVPISKREEKKSRRKRLKEGSEVRRKHVFILFTMCLETKLFSVLVIFLDFSLFPCKFSFFFLLNFFLIYQFGVGTSSSVFLASSESVVSF